MPNEIPVVFHRGLIYDYSFIIKELANEFEGQCECTGENKEKYKTFSVLMKKEIIKMDKDCNKTVETISYKIKFIDWLRLMESLLSNLVDNLAEGINKIKCKDCDCFFEYENVKDDLTKYKCSSCNKGFSDKLNEKLRKKFKNTLKFSNDDINYFFCC